MPISRSGYVGTAYAGGTHPVKSCVKKALSFLLVLAMIMAVALSAMSSMGHGGGDIRDIVAGLGVGNKAELGSSLRALGMKSADASDWDCDTSQGDECESKANDAFNDFKNSSLGDSGFQSSDDSELKTPGDDSVNSNWAYVMDQGSKNQNINPSSGDGTKNFVDVFSMVMKRLMPGYYLNTYDPTSDDVDAWKNSECNATDNAPTLKNSNCDVPNITTEAIQNLVSSMDNHGIQNAGLAKATTPFGLGFSRELLPTSDVPVDLSKAQYKYTGLEAFGYGLRWSTYNGEWDHIAVQTENRFKTSMTFGGGVKTWWQTFVAGAKGSINGLGDAVNDIGDDFKNGNWVKAAYDLLPWNIVGKVVSKAAGSALYRLLNNIMNGFEVASASDGSWYRPYFVGETMYGVVALTPVERNAIINQKAADTAQDTLDYIISHRPEEYSETTVRSWYSLPRGPRTTYLDGKVVEDESEDWHAWKNAEDVVPALTKATNELHMNMNKYDGQQYKGWSADNLYSEFKRDYFVAVKNKVAEVRDEYAKTIKDMLMDTFLKKAQENVITTMTARPAQAWMYCTKDDGSPDGVPGDPATVKAMHSGTVRKLGKEAYGINGDKPWQCSSSERPTVVGGLLGSARKNPVKADTRRTAYSLSSRMLSGIGSSLKLIPLSNDQWNEVANSLFSISQRVVMVLNTLIGWSFTPILERFGIKSIVMDWTKKLRDTVYMQFLVMAIAIAGLMIILKLVRGHPVESFKQLAAILLTVGLCICLLFNTKLMFQLVDDFPSALERGIIGTVFQSGKQDEICTATGTPKGTVSASGAYSSLFGDKHTFNPDAQVRVMQCKIWQAFVFTPWTYGQFGSGWNELWANGHRNEGHGSSAKQLNTSADTNKLVGSASVHLGNGKTLHNWALYQLASMTTGTITTQDLSRPEGALDKNMYRLVDVQAGPNGGAGRDASHFDAWRSNPWGRTNIAIMSLFLSIVGAIGLGGMTIKKIEYTLTATLMLLISPIIMLFGVLPGKNRLRLKQYGFEVLSLCLKRLAVVFTLSIGIEILIEAGMATSGSWFASMLALALICLVIKFYGSELVDKLTASVNEKSGRWQSANDVVRNAVENNDFMASMSDTMKSGLTAVAGGVIGGMIAGGGVKNIRRNMFGSQRAAKKELIDDFMAKMSDPTSLLGREQAAWAASGGKGSGPRWTKARNNQRAMLMIQRARKGQDINTGRVLTTAEARARNNKMLDRALTQLGVFDALANVQTMSASQAIGQQFRVINNRLYHNRLVQGRTSPLWEFIKQEHLDKESDDGLYDVRRQILERMNATSMDSQGMLSRINHAVFNGVSMGSSLDDSAGFQLDKGQEGEYFLNTDNMAALVMSCKNPRQLLADLERAESSSDPMDWNKVRADLMDGNVMDKDSEAYRIAWGTDPDSNDAMRLADKATVRRRLDDGDADMTSKFYDMKAKMIAERASSASPSPIVKDEEVIDRLVRERMMNGDAAYEMSASAMADTRTKETLAQEKESIMDDLMPNEEYYNDKGERITREQAKAIDRSPEKMREWQDAQEELDRNTKPLRDAQQREAETAEELRQKERQLRKDAKDGSKTDHERVMAKMKADELAESADAHEKSSRNYAQAATVEEDKVRSQFNVVAQKDEQWFDVASANLEATYADMMAKSGSMPQSHILKQPVIDARTKRPLLDKNGKQITFGDYMDKVNTVLAIDEQIKVIDASRSIDILKDRVTERSREAKLDKSGSLPKEVILQNKKDADMAERYAKQIDPDANVRVTGRGNTVKFMFTGGTTSGWFLDFDDVNDSMDRRHRRYDKAHADPVGVDRNAELNERVERSKAASNPLRAAAVNHAAGVGTEEVVTADRRAGRMGVGVRMAVMTGANTMDALSKLRHILDQQRNLHGTHHSDRHNYDTRHAVGRTSEEIDTHVYREHPTK